MTVNRTTLLDLPLPVTGTESGTWGDTTNNGLTQYMDIAIAGMSNLTSANFTTGALTIETTEGNSSATNITATSGQYAGFRVTSLAQNSTITVGNTGTNPARSYRLINADATYTLTFKATGQTGITLQPGQTAVVAFNGTDYVIVGMAGAGTVTDNAVVRFDGTTGKLVQNSVVTIADSTGDISGVGQLNATTVDTTNLEVTNIKAIDGTAAASIANSTGVVSITANPVLSGGTANGVLYLNGSKVATSGSALTFDGTTLNASTGSPIIRATASTTGALYGFELNGGALDAFVKAQPNIAELRIASGRSVGWGGFTSFYIDTSEQMRLTSTGLGIGTSSPAYKLDLTSSHDGYARQWLSAVSFVSSADAVNGFQLRNLGSGTQGIKFANFANTVEWMRLDSSGNLGLGVTPSTYNVGRAVEVGAVGNSFWTTSNDVYLTANTFYQSGYKYAASTYASMYEQTSGAHKWFTAPSGTAGNAITFTQAMTLDASGNLALGLTSASGRLHVQGSGEVAIIGSSAQSLYFRPDSGGTMIATGAGQTGVGTYYASTSNFMYFMTNNAERARITSGGDFRVKGAGTAGSTDAFQVSGSAPADAASIDSSGKLLVGTTVTNSGISLIPSFSSSGSSGIDIKHPSGAPSGDYFQTFQYNAGVIGSITQNGVSQVLYNISSDQRLKENIQDADSASGLIDALKVRQFDWKADGSHQRYGFVAQEMVAVAPEAVHQPTDPESMMAVDYSKLVPMLIKEVQSLRARVAALEGN